MAANPVNPGPSAGATPGPAAVPSSAPSSTPTPSPAPAATPTPAAVETAKPEGILAKITDAWSKMPAAEEPAAEPVTEEPASEPVAAEPAEPAAEVTEPEAAKPAEPVAEAVPELVLDELDGGPAAFMAEVGKDPAAKAFFDAHPEWKNTVNAALRRSGDAKKIAEVGIFPANAPTIAKAAATFQSIDNHFLSGANEDGTANPEGIQEFLNSWVREAMFTDDKGAPIMEDGKYKLHPALTHTLNHIYSNNLASKLDVFEKSGKLSPELAGATTKVLSYLLQKATATGDERQQAGLEIAREVLASLSSPAQGEVPDELKPLADSLKADRAALDTEKQTAARQQQEQRTAQAQSSLDASDSKAADNFLAQVKPSFTKAGLTEFESNAAIARIGTLIDAKLDANEVYKAERGSLIRQLKANPGNEKLQQELTKLTIMHGQEYLAPITAEVIRLAKGGALTRQAARDAKVTTQKTESAADPRGTTHTPSAPQTQAPKDLRAQVIKEYMDSHGGDRPDTAYIVTETWKRTQAAQQKKAS